MIRLPKDTTAERIRRIEVTLEKILTWLRVSNIRSVRDLLDQELDTPEKKVIYELTDGQNSQKEISNLVGLSRRTVSYYWQKWLGLGIVTSRGDRKGRMKRIISLGDLGISVPDYTKSKKVETRFKAQDLKKILSDEKLIKHSDIADLAIEIFPAVNVDILQTRRDLVNFIMQAFKESDRMKQALFIQALERKVQEKKDTEFRKFFESWEAHIQR
jgi:predicted transcriptional regulator